VKKRLEKYVNKPACKEDFRKFGINLLTASAVGGFVTHVTDMTRTELTMLVVLAVVGALSLGLGLYQKQEQ
jgi:hypothetical protein